MLKKLVRGIWRLIAPSTRARLVRATQDHFTVSTAAIITNEDDQVLLLNHVLRPYSGWGFPGGFVDHGEPIEDAIRREVREEIGIDLEYLELFEVNTLNRHIEILWSAQAAGEPEVRSAEIIELRWFSPDDVPLELGGAQKRQIVGVLQAGKAKN